MTDFEYAIFEMHILIGIFKCLLPVILVLPVVKIHERSYITVTETI